MKNNKHPHLSGKDGKMVFQRYDSHARHETLFCKLDRLADFIDNAIIGVYEISEKGEVIYANNKLASIFGFSSLHNFLQSVSNIDLLCADTGDRRKLMAQMEAKGFVDNAEIAFKKSDGQRIWASISGRVVDDESGGKSYWGFMVDITDRKNALNALHESEARFRQLVTQASEGFFLHDFKGKILDVNRQACVSLGFSRDDLLKMNLADIDIEIRKNRHQLKYWEKLEPYEHITFESKHQRKDGMLFPVEVRLGRIDLEEGRLLLSFARDITDRIRKDEELKRAFSEIKQLKDQLQEENTHLRRRIELEYGHEEIIGESHSIKTVLSLAEKVARQNTCVLITGETGTGKELLAHAIHNMSERKDRPMVKVNCAALPPTLIESELFGRERGAYTDALSRRAGRFEEADQSTIFLDEIGDLPLELQAKLLRALQEGQFERLGSSQTITVDVRIIAATNQDLDEMIREGRFRKDLYYRLNVFPLTVPPLRARPGDIPLLTWAFVHQFAKSMGKQITSISKGTMERMVRHAWPGNVRELKNVIERAIIISSGERLEIQGLAATDVQAGNQSLEEVERRHILSILRNMGWRVSGKNGAANVLGLKPTTLEARMKKLGIKRPD
ncbi:MAG: sigma 54-interacting transcriptional regulator [Desulfatitalea sp.]|nr:sigma 54-interacting transcriptional regulator [Desulfatitalea sp.]NNK00675.1 sigma 54-interacting transcriptional regulator [Desulfatitalea sp.]